MRIAFVALTALLLLFSSGLSIRITPRIVFLGGAVRLTCKVPPNNNNRWLDAILPGYRSSGQQLEGADAKITYEFLFEHIPCIVDEGVCAVTDNMGDTQYARLPLQVAGCVGSEAGLLEFPLLGQRRDQLAARLR